MILASGLLVNRARYDAQEQNRAVLVRLLDGEIFVC